MLEKIEIFSQLPLRISTVDLVRTILWTILLLYIHMTLAVSGLYIYINIFNILNMIKI